MTTLLDETIADIEASGHKITDIVFIGSQISGHQCTWEEFRVLAAHKYDSGFGAQKVAADLIIVFSDGKQMRREEYDGSEWWEYSEPFITPISKKKISSLFVKPIDVGWQSLEDINP